MVLETINKIDNKLKNYYMLLEKYDYVKKLKAKFIKLEIYVTKSRLNENGFDLIKFNEALNEFDYELKNLRNDLGSELANALDERKMRNKRVRYFKKIAHQKRMSRIREAFVELFNK